MSDQVTPPKELLTAVELAERLRVKSRTIQDWRRSGIIPSILITPKVIRYDLASVIESLRHSGEVTNV